MKAAQKNWSLPNNRLCFLFKSKMGVLLILFFVCISNCKSQIANYVNNGSFEVPKYANAQKAKYWDGIDTNKYVGILLSEIISPYLVPLCSFTYQWPKSGHNHFISTLLLNPNTPQSTRGYPRNVLKQTLQAGKTYCVKFYFSISNQSSYGIDGLGAYFGDNTTDTISQCSIPINHLIPQIQNPANNILPDTLNWSLLTGTFVANGTEKYMVLGNFKSDVSTNSVLINPANLPVIFCDVLYDDVSVMDIDLPAYAGPDIFGIPNNTVYIGRPQDVGIDEACMWYHLPNITTAIDTAAGITVTVAATTQTYMVKQDICGNIKYDTVIVYASGVGLTPLSFGEGMGLRLYPNPANAILNIEVNLANEEAFKLKIFNNLGQVIKEEDIVFKEKVVSIKTNELQSGIYFVTITNDKNNTTNKKLIIAK